MNIKDYIGEVTDFPIEGVSYKDISPLIADADVFREVVCRMTDATDTPDYYVAMEARGFLFASAMSIITGAGVIMCRKKGKLPGKCVSESYELEYATDEFEMQVGIAEEGSTVVVVDDVLATGGSALCACKLSEKIGLVIDSVVVLMEFVNLDGRKNLMKEGVSVKSLIQYE